LNTQIDGRVLGVFNEYPSVVESLMRQLMLDKKSNVWTFWDAMVYAATIYTTAPESELNTDNYARKNA